MRCFIDAEDDEDDIDFVTPVMQLKVAGSTLHTKSHKVSRQFGRLLMVRNITGGKDMS